MKRLQKMLGKTGICIAIAAVLIFTVFPMIWMISTSFKAPSEVYQNPPSLIPREFVLDGYKVMLFGNTDSVPFLKWVKNSAIVSLITTAFSMVIALLGGYGLSRFKMWGRDVVSNTILICDFLPASLLVVPLFFVIGQMNLLNTYTGLVLCYITFSIPFCTWMMKGFFDSIPPTLEEAAMVDGCNRFSAFVRIVTPLTLPGLVSTAIFSFITAWNEFLFASIFLKTYDRWTLPIGLLSFDGHYAIDWNSLMAGSVLVTVPIIIIFLVLQKYLISGMTAGAVKQ